MSSPAPEPPVAELSRLVREAQAAERIPSISAAAIGNGEVLWQQALGGADVDGGCDVALLESRLRLARRDRRTTKSARVRELRAATVARAARSHTHDLRTVAAGGDRLLRRALQRPRARRARRGQERVRCSRVAVEH